MFVALKESFKSFISFRHKFWVSSLGANNLKFETIRSLNAWKVGPTCEFHADNTYLGLEGRARHACCLHLHPVQ
jgi:hypothetical protein